MFGFYNHTYNQHYLCDGWPIQLHLSNQDIINDIFSFRKIAYEKYYSYPYGCVNEIMYNALIEYGIKLGFTTNKGYLSEETNPMLIPRIKIEPNMTIDQFKEILND